MVPTRPSLIFALVVLAVSAVPGVLSAQTVPAQNWTPARFQSFVARLNSADVSHVTLLEGLPHQLVEHGAFLRERDTKATSEIGGYYFYRVPLPLTAPEAGLLRAKCMDPQTYGPYSGPKRCGGFHPDYALRWGRGRDTVYTLVCFGCHETQTLDAKQCLIADLPEPAFRKLQALLERYHAQRPPYQKGG